MSTSPAVATSERPDPGIQKFDVIVIGAGFSGIYQLHKLRQLGFSVRILEAGADLGGIWHWNCYPGARVDSHAPIYEYTDEDLWRNWDWSELYPGYEELRRYFDFVDKKWNIRKDTQFNTRVTAMSFDEEENIWTLKTSKNEQFRSQFVVLCSGFAAKPYIPDIPGLESFKGPRHHTALWPQAGVELANRRVGVIGTGASAVQVIQEAAKTAAHLTVFQRTPCFALRMPQRKLDARSQAALKTEYPAKHAMRRSTFGGFDLDFLGKAAMEVTEEERKATYEELWRKGGFHFWIGTFTDVLFNEAANKTAYEFWRDKTRARIKDPEIARILAPDEPPYAFGTKRPSLENGFYEVFNQTNVSLIDLRKNPIERVTPTGILMKNGDHHPLDVLVLGTGFDAVSGGILNIDIRGRNGLTIQQRWRDGVRSYLGLATAGFPNLLFMYGPQSPSGFLNGPTAAELQGDVVISCLRYLRDNGYVRIESTPEADDAWAAHTHELAAATLFTKTDSWYMGANIPGKKREILNYPGGLPLYLEKCEESRDGGYAGFILTPRT